MGSIIRGGIHTLQIVSEVQGAPDAEGNPIMSTTSTTVQGLMVQTSDQEATSGPAIVGRFVEDVTVLCVLPSDTVVQVNDQIISNGNGVFLDGIYIIQGVKFNLKTLEVKARRYGVTS